MKRKNERIESFWKEEYHEMSLDERVKFWSGSLYRSMRDQESSGLKVYAIYTDKWLHDTLEKEPNFIEMLPGIYNLWGGMFSAEKVDKIIHGLLHKS